VEGCRGQHGQKNEGIHGVQVRWLVLREAARSGRVATRIVEQRATGAANCVEIVVVVPGLARDFWREMPSGNAPAPLGRRH
jgi:hypothetical protein